ncbi:hypothetical protein ACFVWG_24890 [Kribbella sp. NPDC058245]|uniref:hypothetical protein n=1 Tax=Kribbella sp. NPDC058245 TaxID=3346399 RepID=UPI0036EEE227
MSKKEIPAGFVDGDVVLDEILAEPGMEAAVDTIDRGVAEMNRIHPRSDHPPE